MSFTIFLINTLLLGIILWLLKKFVFTTTGPVPFLLIGAGISLLYFVSLSVINLATDTNQSDAITLVRGDDSDDDFDSHDPPPRGDFSVVLLESNKISTRFADIAGMNEAKKEVTEIVDFLKNPKVFARLGAKPPKGVLMYGPPGTGKTMMARAIAGEANVAFISTSGSAFDDVYVGVGAKRVRALFDLARKHKPCIVFIDEMDALAGSRNKAGESGNDQTVNQFLTELDNIDKDINEGIIFLGATNRLESIDEAVLRPGRFDRKVFFRLPNLQERKEILVVLLKRVKPAKDLDLDVIAQTTTGYSGADLANLINEAAIDATRKNKESIDMASFEEANDKIILGVNQGSGSYTQKEREMTAYHEAGHALVGLLHPDNPHKFHKMSIGLRGSSLGVTHFRAETEEHSRTKSEFEAMIAGALGGYIAEEIVYGKKNVTSGASSDLVYANEIARAMVADYAMSDLQSLLVDDIISQGSEYIAENASIILQRDYDYATKLINDNRRKLDLIAKTLLTKETLDYVEIEKLIK